MRRTHSSVHHVAGRLGSSCVVKHCRRRRVLSSAPAATPAAQREGAGDDERAAAAEEEAGRSSAGLFGRAPSCSAFCCCLVPSAVGCLVRSHRATSAAGGGRHVLDRQQQRKEEPCSRAGLLTLEEQAVPTEQRRRRPVVSADMDEHAIHRAATAGLELAPPDALPIVCIQLPQARPAAHSRCEAPPSRAPGPASRGACCAVSLIWECARESFWGECPEWLLRGKEARCCLPRQAYSRVYPERARARACCHCWITGAAAVCAYLIIVFPNELQRMTPTQSPPFVRVLDHCRRTCVAWRARQKTWCVLPNTTQPPQAQVLAKAKSLRSRANRRLGRSMNLIYTLGSISHSSASNGDASPAKSPLVVHLRGEQAEREREAVMMKASRISLPLCCLQR